MAKKTAATDDVLRELRAFGLAYPGAHLKSPWPGHMDLAVNDKTFAYLSLEGEPLAISCKLPRSNAMALLLPFCKPAAYGLGKSGWVAASFAQHQPDVMMLKAWIDESYRSQAPKKLIAARDREAPAPTEARVTKARKRARTAPASEPARVKKPAGRTPRTSKSSSGRPATRR